MEHLAAQRIREAQRILIVCHVSPDGDAIGSLLGLGLALGRDGRDVVMACADPVPEALRYLPRWELITQQPSGQFDLVVSLDCSDLERLGTAYDAQALAGVRIVNIDHHTTNVNFGVVNWVDPTAAATAQMLVKLVRALEIPIDAEVATCLLGGILTDTLGFRTANTTSEVMHTAIELMGAGASLSDLTDWAFNRRPLGAIRIWSMALQQIQLDGHILWSEITQAMRRDAGYGDNGDAGLASYLSTANEADIAVVFGELDDGRVSVSMRAVPGYDVSQVALDLGGGGHPQAAGCTLPGPLGTARDTVLSMLGQVWTAQAQSEPG